MIEATPKKKRLKAIREGEKKAPALWFIKKRKRIKKNRNLKIINTLDLFRGKKTGQWRFVQVCLPLWKLLVTYRKGSVAGFPISSRTCILSFLLFFFPTYNLSVLWNFESNKCSGWTDWEAMNYWLLRLNNKVSNFWDKFFASHFCITINILNYFSFMIF